ncbi:hypothetical protein K458DRAFT_388349 [Lentithecium fluviatile CBS 122367]|uniref:Uncharacterized protein n=1 Tax=Lentithecium fluviatile CBS 122367 TaxID=1168545 RepID=A0A6G1J4N0_9PLEO|nr:hypothetical protein K458DRAFT_388349 [Lentithecium fluviatile CBS 122367]
MGSVHDYQLGTDKFSRPVCMNLLIISHNGLVYGIRQNGHRSDGVRIRCALTVITSTYRDIASFTQAHAHINLAELRGMNQATSVAPGLAIGILVCMVARLVERIDEAFDILGFLTHGLVQAVPHLWRDFVARSLGINKRLFKIPEQILPGEEPHFETPTPASRALALSHPLSFDSSVDHPQPALVLPHGMSYLDASKEIHEHFFLKLQYIEYPF